METIQTEADRIDNLLAEIKAGLQKLSLASITATRLLEGPVPALEKSIGILVADSVTSVLRQSTTT
jgi:hypothetical protein